MLKNYLTVALRNLVKNRLYSAINILGLAVGIASCILIVMFVRDELSYDRWFPNAERVYQLQTSFDIPGRGPMRGTQAPGPAAAALEKDFSQIETTVRLVRWRSNIKRAGDVFQETVIMADPTFFDVLDLPLISGDRTTALKNTSSLLISESMARKYFGAAPALGQTLTLDHGMDIGTRDYKVVGVFKDLPSNTHFEIDFLVPINEPDFDKIPSMLKSWTSTNGWTYVKFKPGTDVGPIQNALPEFERRNVPVISFGGQDFNIADFMKLKLVRLTDVHLHSQGGNQRPSGDMKTITTFSAVAAMILLIACINFTNLATARSSQRAREVALRKVLGAKRPQLVAQFLTELVLMALVAFVISLALVEAMLPVYNTLLQRHLALDFLGTDGLLPAMLGVIVLVGLLAGAYPALLLSGFLPARILKANKSAAAEGSGRLRTALVVVQFAISIGLMVCTAVVYGQTIYARTMNLGYDRNGLMVIRSPYGDQHYDLRNTLKAEAAKLPGVKAVTISGDVPTDRNENNNIIEIPGQPVNPADPLLLGQKSVDYDFFATYQIPLLAGRFLDENHGGDDFTGTDEEKIRRGGNIVINEKAVARLGFGTPQNAVGRQLRLGVGGDDRHSEQATVTIVGVVGNIFYRTARDDLAPMYFDHNAQDFRNITIRYDGVSGIAVRDTLNKMWRGLTSDVPFKAEFFDTLIATQYQAEEAEATLFAAFSVLAVVIGCLGLYGLASFTAERRVKEIGIRKVLGAKVRDLVRLLVWDFSKPVLIANVIAWPLAWLLMRDWLNGFQYRINLGVVPFAVAGAGALIIAWVTVAGHAARAARSNPIHALRYE